MKLYNIHSVSLGLLWTILMTTLVVQGLNPVIIVPGLGGSQFEARLNKTLAAESTQLNKTKRATAGWPFTCADHADWYTLWLNLGEMVWDLSCVVDNMKLTYDNVTHTTHNTPGVDTRQPGFGNTDTVEWLDPDHASIIRGYVSNFYYIVEDLFNTLGYVRNVSIRGAPYDFRKAPNEMGDYFDNLTQLIEETYYLNNHSKVVLLTHSMGGMCTLYFLQQKQRQKQQAWIDKFIKSFITLSSPWGGSVKPLRLIASGDNLGEWSHILPPLEVRPMEQSMASTSWLMPYAELWGPNEVLVSSPTTNYTVNDYRQFFHDVEFPNGFLMRLDTQHLVQMYEPPQVEVYCLYGNNTPTAERLIYKSPWWGNWFDQEPHVERGNGDGTVNTRSLTVCAAWAAKQNAPVHLHAFDGAEHLQMLWRTDVIEYIRNILQNKS